MSTKLIINVYVPLLQHNFTHHLHSHETTYYHND